MVYTHNWAVFAAEATRLFDHSPSTVRFTTRWSHSRGLLVLKVTDDKHCLKFKSRSSVILNRFEQLTVNLTSRMQDRQFSSAIPPRGEASSGAVPAPLSANASATDAAKDAAASTAAGPGAGAIASGSAPPKDDAGTLSAKTPSKKKGKGGKKGGKK